jgi:hypothetical protein
MKIFNEIFLSIQLFSNNNDASTVTLSSPHLTSTYWLHFVCFGQKYHQLDKLWLNSSRDTHKYSDTFLVINKEHDFFHQLLQNFFLFHFQGAFIIFSSFSMCFYHIFWQLNILFSKKIIPSF